jgi:hypothetical protein
MRKGLDYSGERLSSAARNEAMRHVATRMRCEASTQKATFTRVRWNDWFGGLGPSIEADLEYRMVRYLGDTRVHDGFVPFATAELHLFSAF